MSTQANHQERANTSKDIFEVSKNNFENYVSEVEKTVPQYFQTMSNYQKTFLDTWKNTFEAVLDVQRKYAQKAQINIDLPEAASKSIEQATNELIKARLVQGQIINATLDATEKNVKSFNESAEAFAEFQNNLIESWFTTFKI
jgi:uncharacterized protein YicC (UPF0701 family)